VAVKLLRENRTVKLDYIAPQPAVTYPIFHSTIFDFQSIKRRALLGVKVTQNDGWSSQTPTDL